MHLVDGLLLHLVRQLHLRFSVVAIALAIGQVVDFEHCMPGETRQMSPG